MWNIFVMACKDMVFSYFSKGLCYIFRLIFFVLERSFWVDLVF